MEKKGGLKLVEMKGYFDVQTRMDYLMYDAMYSKYCEWQSMRERKKGIQVPSLESFTKNKIDFSVDRKPVIKTDPELANLELALAGEEDKMK